MIPHIIHYVWVGNAPKPPIVEKCIASWHRFCPNWEFHEWNDDVIQNVNNRYVREAYNHKKWAFVSDWLRLYVLHKYGGFYLDTDMEILKPIDQFLQNDLTMGLIERHGEILFNGCFIGCTPTNPVIGGLLNLYADIPFVKSNGELDQTPNTVRMVDYFAKQWNVRPTSAHEVFNMGNNRYFYPHNWFLSRDGYTFHHYCASWIDDWVRKIWLSLGRYKLVRFKKRLGVKGGNPKLQVNEKEIFSIRLSKRKTILLLKTKDT